MKVAGPSGRPAAWYDSRTPTHGRQYAIRPTAIVAIALAFVSTSAGRAPKVEPAATRGRWHGTSICTRRGWNSACNDAVAFYEFAAVPPAPARGAEGAWRMVKHAHYTVFYPPGFKHDAALVAAWADRAERLMRRKYGVTPRHYRMSIYLYAEPAGGIDVDNARIRCCTDSTASLSIGTIEMLGPSAPAMRDAHAVSSLGMPKGAEDYQAKVLMSEYIPIGHYELQRARHHGGWRYYDAPNWFVQGLQEYDGIFPTTAGNRSVTARHFLAWAAAHRGAFECCAPEVDIADPCNGGAAFMAFLASEFGEGIHARILRDSSSSFAAALTAATQPYTRAEPLARFDRVPLRWGGRPAIYCGGRLA